jgi:hypothetical protein
MPGRLDSRLPFPFPFAMMTPRTRVATLCGTALLAACASLPSGPSVLVLPGTGRTFEQFRVDEVDCRDYAFNQVGGKTAEEAANESTAKSAALGTAIGALAGAALGGRQGAAFGAGSGLLFGAAAGSGGGYRSSYATQRQYDNAYIQCMYARGHRVPVPAGMAPTTGGGAQATAPTTASSNPPPPPPGGPPPPPPGVR